MPPKQKEVKKGPSYKPSIPLKDIVPLEVKQPPRQPKPIKSPETFPELPKNNQPLPPQFEQWPSEEAVKTHDFGLHSQVKYLDPTHEKIKNYLKDENVSEWKHMNEIVNGEEEQELSQEQEELETFNNQKSSNSLNSVVKNQAKIQEENEAHKSTVVIETYMRPENEAEMQARLQQEAILAEKAAKDKKKANKKEEPKEEGPQQVSDVRMSDIITKKYMVKEAIWIGSQLQVIKQRNLTDVYNNEAIWKKIYPQEQGVPQITKSGKYWVKLFYMGKYVKVEVDDRIPVNSKQQQLFPLSAKGNERWTLIITKALVKYLSRTSNDDIIGNGLITYALTGMVSENISLSNFKQWNLLQDYLNNEHYQKRDIVLSCFSKDSNKSFKKTCRVRSDATHRNVISTQEIEIKQENGQYIEKEIDTKILNGYSYCMGDYFDNQGFNMVFSQEKSQKEVILKHQYNELCKITLSSKTREEKLEYRKKKKELKQKLAIEEKKRSELIGKPPIQYHFVKLLSSLRVDCEYGEKEILLAKKCVVNKLNQPPNYDFPLQKEDKDTKSQASMSLIKYKEESELFPNIHDFSTIPNIIELLERKDEGVWTKETDLLDFFQQIQIFYNPAIFPHKKIEAIESKRPNAFTYDQNKEILVVEKVEQEEEKEGKVRLLLGYSFQKNQHEPFHPYTKVQKFDFDSFRSTSTVVDLDRSLSSKLISLKNQNTVFKLCTMGKGNFNYWISCDSPFKLISIADYLTEFEGYAKKIVVFQYPPVEALVCMPLVRLRLRQEGQEENTVLLKLQNCREQLLGSLNYRLVAVPKDERPFTTELQEGIIEKIAQKTLLTYEYSRFVVSPEFEYYIVIEGCSPDNIPDGSLQLLLLTKNEGISIEQTEQVEPVKFIEKYNPNKYGMIFKERFFTNSDNNVSISAKIVEGEEVQASGGGDKKAAKKGGKEETSAEIIQKPFTGQRNIILKILNGETVLYETRGVNEINIPNYRFFSTKGAQNKEYYISLEFDLRLWPQCKVKNEGTQKICWVVQIFSQDTVALVRDTKQEDREKLTRKSWEDKEPGRAERAKKIRRKFLIEMKKENGENLTEEEQQILNAPKLTKKQMLQQQKKLEDKKGKGGKKDDKKPGKDAKKEEAVEEKIVERDPPKSKDNFMNEIKEYLSILENCVVKYEKLNDGQHARIRSEEQIKAIREGALMALENRVGKLIRNIEERETVKIREKEKKEELSIFFGQAKSQFKSKLSHYTEWRNQDAEKDKLRQDKERLLIDIINQEKPTISEAELKKHIAEYLEISGHNPFLGQVATMVRKNIKIANVSDKIVALLPAWEIEELKNLNEQIKNEKIEGIDDDVMRQLKEVLEQAEKNPNLALQKQNEAKKGKKGGKK